MTANERETLRREWRMRRPPCRFRSRLARVVLAVLTLGISELCG